jgi:hypothetical protein
MACTGTFYARAGATKVIRLYLRDRDTLESIPLPGAYVRADFRASANSESLLRITSEDGGFTLDPDDSNVLLLTLTAAQTTALAPGNEKATVIFDIEFRDDLESPTFVTAWQTMTLVITPAVTYGD